MHIDDVAKEWEPARAIARYEKVARERDEMRETLRDRFAMATLTGLVAIFESDATAEQFAEKSYMIADAMMKCRVTKPDWDADKIMAREG